MNKRGMQDDAPGWRSEGRSLVTGVNLWVLIACVAFGAWGAFDSMTDAEGDRIWGSLSVATPAVYAGWCMLEPALRPSLNIGGLLVRMSSACLVAPGFVALPVGLIQAVATIVPGTRATIATATADNGGFHYYWAEGIAAQLFLVPFMGWILGMCAALGVCLILSLPVLSFRAPAVIRDGSHLEKVNPTDRDSTTAFVFCGLGATILGIGLWLFGDGGSILEFPGEAARELSDLSRYGEVQWDDVMWLCGVILVVAGGLAMGWGCVRVMIARARA